MSRKTRKLIWSAPLVAVFAVIGALAIFAAQTPNVALAAPPDAPALATATAAPDGKTVELTITAAGGGDTATGYRIEASRGGPGSFNLLVTRTATELTYTHSVQPGSTWSYRVRGRNADGDSVPSNIITVAVPNVPGKPVVTVTDDDNDPANGLSGVTGTSIAIGWRTLTGADLGGAAAITGYQVEHSATGSAPWTVAVDADADNTAITFDHTSLMNGVTRHYRVAAENSVGLGPYSKVVMATTRDVPGKPTLLMAELDDGTTAGNVNVELSWTAPDENGGSPITAYRVETFRASTGNWANVTNTADPVTVDDSTNTVTTGTPIDTEYVNADVPPGTTVFYRVKTRNAIGLSEASETLPVLTWAVPGTPTGLMASASSETRIDLSWTAPTDTGRTEITGYRIEGSVDGVAWDTTATTDTAADATPYVKVDTDSDATTYTHSGLSAGNTRYYRVYAINGVGRSREYSNIADATTFIVPGAAQDPPGVTVTREGPSMLKLTWSSSGDAATGYQIRRSPNGATMWTDPIDTGSTDLEYTDTGLTARSTWFYQVRAIYPTGNSMWSSIKSGTTALEATVAGKPTMLTATAATATSSIDLSWMAPVETGGTAITGYIVERRYTDDMMGNIPTNGYNADAGGASFAFSNYKEWWETLNCTGMLAVAMAEDNDANRGMYCKHFPNVMPTNAAFADAMISDAIAMKVKDLFMKRYVSDDMGDTMTVTGTMHTDADLMANTQYTYRVSAVNSVGRSSWSDAAMATTGEGNEAPTESGTIADVSVIAGVTMPAMDVSGYFMDADTGDMLTYTATSDMAMYATVNIPDGSSMMTIIGVAAGQAMITVTATDQAGATAMQTFTVTVTAAMLTAPGNVMAQVMARDGDPGIHDVTVTWTDGANAITHAACLYDSSRPRGQRVVECHTGQTDGTTQFSNVDSGTYAVVVVALDDDFNMELALAPENITVP